MTHFMNLPHVTSVPIDDIPAINFVQLVCPLCHCEQTTQKFFTYKREFCALGGGVYLVRCWDCGENFTMIPYHKGATASTIHRVTEEEIATIPQFPQFWGIPF